MRELYAVGLDGDGGSDNVTAARLAQEWADRHRLPFDGASNSQGLWQPALVDHETGSDGAQLFVLRQESEATEVLTTWRSEVAVGPPEAPLNVTVRICVAAATPGPLCQADVRPAGL